MFYLLLSPLFLHMSLKTKMEVKVAHNKLKNAQSKNSAIPIYNLLLHEVLASLMLKNLF